MLDQRNRLLLTNCFGTVLKIHDNKDVYKELFDLMGVAGYEAKQLKNDVMRKYTKTEWISLMYGDKYTLSHLSNEDRRRLNDNLNTEISSIDFIHKDIPLQLNQLKDNNILALVSNVAGEYTDAIKTHLDVYDKVFCSSIVGYTKPSEMMRIHVYNKIRRKASCLDEVIMLGDNPKNDIQRALDNGADYGYVIDREGNIDTSILENKKYEGKREKIRSLEPLL